MTLFKRTITIVTIAASLLVLSCNSTKKSSEPSKEHTSVEFKSDSNFVEIQKDSIIDSIGCLDALFIENLETGWSSGYKDSRLIKNGFTFESIRNIDHGKERYFKNHTLETALKISKVEYPDGAFSFTVNYQITQEQLRCFEKSLNNSSNYKLKNGKYTKKGLGTYADKHFSMDSNSLWITYLHNVGKELSLPQMNGSLNEISRD